MKHNSSRTRRPSRRVAAALAAGALSVGIVVGTAVPAQAIGMYYLHSSWIEASAGLTSSTNEGNFQAKAQVGGNIKWGAYSHKNTTAYVSGFSTTHQATLFRNNVVWKKAQN